MDRDIKIKVVVDGDNAGIALKKLINDVDELGAASVKSSETVKNSLSKIGSIVTGVNQAIELAKKTFDVLSQPIKWRMETEQVETQLNVLIGDAKKTKQTLDDLRTFADATPFDLTQLTKPLTTLLNYQVPLEQATEILHRLGDISGGSSEKLESLALVFGQVSSNGKLMGQDLLQFINAGFNPLLYISKATGESMEELRDRMSKGGISINEVADAIRKATSEGGQFNGMLQEQSKTIAGRLSTLQGNFRSFVEDLVAELEPLIKKVLEFGVNLIQGLMANKKYFKKIINALVGAIEFVVSIIDKYRITILITVTAIGIYILAVKSATLATKVWAAAQRILNMVLSMSPLGWIVTAIVAIIVAISAVIEATIGWDKAWQYVKATIFGVWAAIKEIFSSVVTGLQSMGQGIKKIFEGDIKGGFAALGEGLIKIYLPDVITAFRNEYNKTLDEAIAKTEKAAKKGNKDKKTEAPTNEDMVDFFAKNQVSGGDAGGKGSKGKRAEAPTDEYMVDFIDVNKEIEERDKFEKQQQKDNEDFLAKNQVSTQYNIDKELEWQKQYELQQREKQAREENTQHEINNYAMRIRSAKQFTAMLKEAIRDRIKAIISEAIATQIGKVIAEMPFPVNAILAPAAGLAIGALFEKLIPRFETGGILGGSEYTGDRLLFRGNSGEMILTMQQQANLLSLLSAPNTSMLQMANILDKVGDKLAQMKSEPAQVYFTADEANRTVNFINNMRDKNGV
jgi:tape measure domain-containing protein